MAEWGKGGGGVWGGMGGSRWFAWGEELGADPIPSISGEGRPKDRGSGATATPNGFSPPPHMLGAPSKPRARAGSPPGRGGPHGGATARTQGWHQRRPHRGSHGAGTTSGCSLRGCWHPAPSVHPKNPLHRAQEGGPSNQHPPWGWEGALGGSARTLVTEGLGEPPKKELRGQRGKRPVLNRQHESSGKVEVLPSLSGVRSSPGGSREEFGPGAAGHELAALREEKQRPQQGRLHSGEKQPLKYWGG